MTKYDDSPKQSEVLELRESLVFPDGADFAPAVRRKVPRDFLSYCASQIPRLRERSGYRQRRLENQCEIEFDLDHPERVPSSFPQELLNELLKGL